MGKEGYAKFIEKKVGPGAFVSGTFVLPNGDSVGQHRGVHEFTVGQRKGLPSEIQNRVNKLGIKGDLYISSIDPNTGTVKLALDKDLYRHRFLAQDFNWMSGADFSRDREVTARIRSRHEGAKATARIYAGGRVLIHFAEAQRAITPGQAVVLYEGETVLGGGWIEQVLEEA